MNGLGGTVRNSCRRSIAGVVGIALIIAPFANAGASTVQNIGDAQVVVNDVRGAIGNRAPETLRAGIDVFQNEIIRTGERSASRVLFQDNTTLAIGAASEITLDRFVFDETPGETEGANLFDPVTSPPGTWYLAPSTWH